MKNKLLYKLRSGKNPKIIYYSVNVWRLLMPKVLFRMRLYKRLASLSCRKDKEYIEKRVDYYNKLSGIVQLPLSAPHLAEHKMGGQKVYFFDTYQYTRWFPDSYRWGFCPGDVTHVPEYPSIVKSRPLTENNENSVVMKLDKVRHFIFVNDKKPFTAKKDKLIFRGKVKGKASRRAFMEMYFHHPMCDLGDVSKNTTDPQEWQTEKKTIREHLDYKFILALEGNDVASNLKWIMSSNSIAVMPRPTCETWFMEGTLIPNYHYIEIKPDFSDLELRLCYYIEHIDEAQQIIKHANEYVSQFKDKSREDLISLLVLNKYFKATGQKLAP
ncbi:glycosyl transferase family 90 [Bacteroides faecichinchillae]|uniref:Glycosyl transferase family 90 n=1 Tax=Bacteroides faecichinchillae TaxID=871325 RepID=A0A1M4ZMU5_9BACE|nr:glycosyl transferase family 90 [Bacteroides faecichinchillae]THG67731.1 lipopolysaccharide biosynthesis protein [Bacteroides faecichinchillae]SHF19363.1 Glycosyl transferase family 90 [Bacteroides faecichinchillae]